MTCRAVVVTHVIKLMDRAQESAIVVGLDKGVSIGVLLVVCQASVTNLMELA